jgi:hypothetical protein
VSKQLTPERRAARAAARHAAQRAQEAGSAGRWSRRRPAGAATAALVLVVVAGVALVSSGGDGRTPRAASSPTASAAPAQAWRDAALRDLRPLTSVVVRLGTTVNDWQSGKLAAKDAGRALDALAFSMQEARTAIGQRAPLTAAPRALDDLRLTAELYLQATRVASLATGLPGGPLQVQLQRQFSRLRDLADRFFDQTDVELRPLLGAPRDITGVEVRRSAEVPDWDSIGLAVGPPLAVPGAATSPRSYQTTRPQQAFSAWKADVERAAIPSGTAEATALTGGTQHVLGDLAGRFVASSDALYARPDPAGERAVSTRLQLVLLVHAEALRAAQAAQLVPAGAGTGLARVATALAVAADGLWDARLGSRTTGLTAPAVAG